MADAPTVRNESIKIGIATVITFWVGSHLLTVLWWLVRQPAAWVAAITGYAVWWLWDGSGSWALTAAAAMLLAALVAWRLSHPASFRPALSWPLRAWWRRVFLYQREWQPVMRTLKLAAKDGEEWELPELVRIRCTSTVDKVRVRMRPGQVLADFAKNADRFATTFEALDCRVRSVYRRQLRKHMMFRLKRWLGRDAKPPTPKPTKFLELWFLIEDPLVTQTPLFQVPERPNLKAVPLALREDGLAWSLRLLANHLLVIGATGAGKGSVLWSLIRALGHGIRTRLVEVWVIDPKGGMEFAAGQRLFARFCYGDDETDDQPKKRAFELSYAEFLERAVDIMRDRQRRLRGIIRAHKPSPGDPLILILIDEIASLTAYVVDREAKKRIEAALNLLLTQGRALGVVVVGAGQDGRKEVVAMRGLFPTRVALRLNEAEDVDTVLGGGVRERGARCDEIPESLPGVGFVRIETSPEPVRVRFAYVTDDEIDTMCSLYAPGSTKGLHLVGDDTDTDEDDPEEAA